MVHITTVYTHIITFIMVFLSILSSLNQGFPINDSNSTKSFKMQENSTDNAKKANLFSLDMNEENNIIKIIEIMEGRELNSYERKKIYKRRCLGVYNDFLKDNEDLFFKKLSECYECFELNGFDHYSCLKKHNRPKK